MKFHPVPILLAALLLSSIFFTSCRKQSFNTSADAALEISRDSVYFDTLFTSTGSVTQSFKIFNSNKQKLRLDNISLAGGESSFFSINADGWEGPVINSIEMEASDSIHVFVTVKIDPSSANLPFIIEDSIKIAYNGTEKRVKLSAWGQNADFLTADVIEADTTWTAAKPIVIIGGVLVPENVKLTIEAGARIFLHADAPVLVDGTLTAIGGKSDSARIFFSGDRLDNYYNNLPGSWPGIYFREKSKSNHLEKIIVRNAYQGVVIEKPAGNNDVKLVIREVVIDNCYDVGLLAVNSSVRAVNCVISNCGRNVMLVQGGDYEFIHCTDVAISNRYVTHQQPALLLTDFIKVGNDLFFGNMKASFTNCIFWGSDGIVEDEVVVIKEGELSFDVDFVSCLWKVKSVPPNVTVSSLIENEDPQFLEVQSLDNSYNFRLSEGSAAIDAGAETIVEEDMDGNPRIGAPDIGAYESTF